MTWRTGPVKKRSHQYLLGRGWARGVALSFAVHFQRKGVQYGGRKEGWDFNTGWANCEPLLYDIVYWMDDSTLSEDEDFAKTLVETGGKGKIISIRPPPLKGVSIVRSWRDIKHSCPVIQSIFDRQAFSEAQAGNIVPHYYEGWFWIRFFQEGLEWFHPIENHSYTMAEVLQSVLPEGTAHAYQLTDLHPDVCKIAKVACSDLTLFGLPEGSNWSLKEELTTFHARKRYILAAAEELARLSSQPSQNVGLEASAFVTEEFEALFEMELLHEGVYIKYRCGNCSRLF
ncbi:uncharacterized protein EI90DRAFT_3022088 [Cantharellus anzutake]|uniref:uncharacterized protein n=1 Tax=Cantharellus anzutake TaxID=1750568 RepID=UPI001906E54F|nr:uncharacterized protein EI90DRAFT_3022088 [Cantharellus anzutake]KAF8315066.1 hypothetical protein EI90DRAFT_3022088 [Cantharellus anzutake]